jgi:hypothetical protein
MNNYLAYLVRLWQVETETGPVWRAVLEDPHSAEQQGFADLSGLVAFLVEKTGAVVETPDPSPHPLKEEYFNEE